MEKLVAVEEEHGRVAEVVASIAEGLAQLVPGGAVHPYAQVPTACQVPIVGALHCTCLAWTALISINTAAGAGG